MTYSNFGNTWYACVIVVTNPSAFSFIRNIAHISKFMQNGLCTLTEKITLVDTNDCLEFKERTHHKY